MSKISLKFDHDVHRQRTRQAALTLTVKINPFMFSYFHQAALDAR
jgi:hypothetical protein